MKIGYRLDAFIVILEVEFFIRGVEVVIIQSEAHEYDLDTEFLFQDRTDGNAASSAHRNGHPAKSGLDGFGCRLVPFAVDRCHIGLATMMLESMYGNGGRCYFPEMVEQQ